MSSPTPPVEQLVACVEAGDEVGVEALVGRHAGVVNVVRSGKEERTALFVAARLRSERMVKLLHRCGAVLEIVNDVERTAVHYAAIGKPDDWRTMDALIKAGADGNRTDEFGFTPLHVACHNGNVEIAKYLARNVSIDVFAATPSGQMALDLARLAGVADMLPELAFARTKCKEDELVFACEHNLVATVRHLIGLGVNTNARKAGGSNRSALHIAVGNNCLDIVKLLCRQGKANPNVSDSSGTFIIHTAMENDTTDGKILEELLRVEVNVNEWDSDGYSPLMLAIRRNLSHHVNELLGTRSIDAGAVSPKLRKSAADLACELGFPEFIRKIKAGSSGPRVVDRLEIQRFQLACETGNMEDVRRFLSLSADVDTELNTVDGETGCMRAAMYRQIDVVKYLLEHRASVTRRNRMNRSLVHYAVRRRYGPEHYVGKPDPERDSDSLGVRILEMLVPLNANFCAMDKANRQPIHYAASLGHLRIANFLLTRTPPSQSALVRNPQNISRKTPLDLAKEFRHESMVLFLEGKLSLDEALERQQSESIDSAVRAAGGVATVTGTVSSTVSFSTENASLRSSGSSESSSVTGDPRLSVVRGSSDMESPDDSCAGGSVQLEAEIQSLRRKVEAFEGENRQLRARVVDLEASLEGGANLLKELAQAKERCEDLECSVAILTDGNSSLGKRLDVAEAEKAALLRSLDEALVAIARLQAGHASTS